MKRECSAEGTQDLLRIMRSERPGVNGNQKNKANAGALEPKAGGSSTDIEASAAFGVRLAFGGPMQAANHPANAPRVDLIVNRFADVGGADRRHHSTVHDDLESAFTFSGIRSWALRATESPRTPT